jgi:riboflavin kinase/FMN adenylyltransferase
MRLIRRLRGRAPGLEGCVATIGNFDGVHRGHQAVLSDLKELAAARGAPGVVLSFEPTPQEFLRGAAAPARLTSLREKHARLAGHGLDALVALPFDARLAALEATDFVSQVLVEGLGVAELVVGDDFRFGRGRGGDFALLQRLGVQHGFTVRQHRTVDEGGERISSTRVRAALAAGDLDLAERLLGWRYGFRGRVRHGDARGRTLGFPTANLALGRHATPATGVYLVRVRGAGAGVLHGAASVGRRPAVGGTDLRCEVHLFDFTGDLYGRQLEVELLSRLRDEWDFDSLDALRAQIARDVEAARGMLINRGG